MRSVLRPGRPPEDGEQGWAKRILETPVGHHGEERGTCSTKAKPRPQLELSRDEQAFRGFRHTLKTFLRDGVPS